MKLAAVMFALLSLNACGSVERAPNVDHEPVEGPGFGPWTFGMSEAEVVGATQGHTLDLSGPEAALFENGGDLPFAFVFDEEHRLASITVWLAKEEGDRRLLLASWVRLYDYLDRRGHGVNIPHVTSTSEAHLDPRAFGMVFTEVLQRVEQLLHDGDPASNRYAQFPMSPRVAPAGLKMTGTLLVTSRSGSVSLVIEPADPGVGGARSAAAP